MACVAGHCRAPSKPRAAPLPPGIQPYLGAGSTSWPGGAWQGLGEDRDVRALRPAPTAAPQLPSPHVAPDARGKGFPCSVSSPAECLVLPQGGGIWSHPEVLNSPHLGTGFSRESRRASGSCFTLLGRKKNKTTHQNPKPFFSVTCFNAVTPRGTKSSSLPSHKEAEELTCGESCGVGSCHPPPAQHQPSGLVLPFPSSTLSPLRPGLPRSPAGPG